MGDINTHIIEEIMSRKLNEARLRAMERTHVPTNPLPKEMERLRKRVDAVDIWLSILPAAHAFIVKRHLVDQLQWSFVEREYSRLWPGESERTVRTLARYQTTAIGMIKVFVQENWASFADLFEDE